MNFFSYLPKPYLLSFNAPLSSKVSNSGNGIYGGFCRSHRHCVVPYRGSLCRCPRGSARRDSRSCLPSLRLCSRRIAVDYGSVQQLCGMFKASPSPPTRENQSRNIRPDWMRIRGSGLLRMLFCVLLHTLLRAVPHTTPYPFDGMRLFKGSSACGQRAFCRVHAVA